MAKDEVKPRYNADPMKKRAPGGRPVTLWGRLRPLMAPLLVVGSAVPVMSAPAPLPGKSSRTRAALLWPLPQGGATLSSFGEYRYDHVHAGVDISTGGATGIRVLAAASGEVFRLKVEWRGYGRALYLRHPGGRVTVYGHLERYEDRVLGLERLVARRQAAAGTRYPGDIYLDHPVRVSRGQVIAYSGESGVGLPHLHFEVRDKGDEPMDPFAAGLQRPADRRPPVLQSLTVTAASPEAFVDGARREATYPLRRDAAGLLTTERPIAVSGPFLAALSAYDPAGDSGRAGVGAIEVRVDGELRYQLGLRTFRFDQYPQSGLVVDHRFSRLGPATFSYRLYRLPGNDFDRSPVAPVPPVAGGYPGAYDLPDGPHLMEISVTDATQNRSRARVCIQSARPPAVQGLERDDRAGVVRFRLTPNPPAPPRVSKSASACAAPTAGIDAEYLDSGRGEFKGLTCALDDLLCRLPPEAAGRPTPPVRLRAVRYGVPGPWSLVAGAPVDSPPAHDAAVRVETWPAFLDVLVTLPAPSSPPLLVTAGAGRNELDRLSYRDDLTAGAAFA